MCYGTRQTPAWRSTPPTPSPLATKERCRNRLRRSDAGATTLLPAAASAPQQGGSYPASNGSSSPGPEPRLAGALNLARGDK
jgi:hypothetical protein